MALLTQEIDYGKHCSAEFVKLIGKVKGFIMKLKSVVFATLAVASIFAATGGAQASVVGLFNTGVTPGVDTHYTFNGGANNTTTYFNTAYAANNAASSWISTTSNGGLGTATVDIDTKFTVLGSQATITGLWGVDNAATVFLDGVQVASLTGYLVPNFSTLHAFSFKAGVGTHTLEFAILNDNNPANPGVADGPLALRVDALTQAVPEPSTWAMILLGFAAVGFLSYRRKPRNGMRFA